jgi:hypothetical protein
LFYRALLVLTALVMSMSAGDAQEPPIISREQLLEDQAVAVETAKALATAIAPEAAWIEKIYPELGCFAPDGRIKGYQTSSNLDLRAETLGHDLEDAEAIEIARSWLTERQYEFVRDTKQDNGFKQIWAVKEDEGEGIGISVSAHPGVIGITATTKCRP